LKAKRYLADCEEQLALKRESPDEEVSTPAESASEEDDILGPIVQEFMDEPDEENEKSGLARKEEKPVNNNSLQQVQQELLQPQNKRDYTFSAGQPQSSTTKQPRIIKEAEDTYQLNIVALGTGLIIFFLLVIGVYYTYSHYKVKFREKEAQIADLVRKSELELNHHNFDKSRAYLNEVLKISPGNKKILQLIDRSHTVQKKTEIERKKYARNFLAEAQRYFERNNIKRAQHYLNLAQDKDPTMTELAILRKNIADSMEKQNQQKVEQEKQVLEKIRKLLHEVEYYLAEEEFELAAKKCQQALNLKPEYRIAIELMKSIRQKKALARDAKEGTSE